MLILGIDPGTATTGWGVVQQTDSTRPPGFARRSGRGKQKADNGKKKSKEGFLLPANCFLSLVDFGCILTSSEDPMGKRLLIIKRALQKVIKNHKPDCMVIERLFFGANSTSALSVGQARGVVLLVAEENKLPIYEYTGLQVKLTVANHGRADKKSIQIAVRKYLRVNKLPMPKNQLGKPVFRFRDDAYDAVAATICHVLKSDVRPKT